MKNNETIGDTAFRDALAKRGYEVGVISPTFINSDLIPTKRAMVNGRRVSWSPEAVEDAVAMLGVDPVDFVCEVIDRQLECDSSTAYDDLDFEAS